MIAPASQNLTSGRKIEEGQINERGSMITRTMADRNPIQVTTSRWTNLLNRMSQVCWRVSFEMEPLLRNLFTPFTAKIHQCRLLSNRERAELEALMKKRSV